MSSRKPFLVCIFLVCCTLLSACSTTLKDYNETQPTIELDQFLNGPLKAWGMVENRSGKVTNRFVVDMTGRWENNIGTLEEYFTYDDGRKETRIWTITKDGRFYKGTAADVIGQANGESKGFAFTWNYTLKLNTGKRTINVKLKDWIYQIDDQVVINTADIKKFGITVGKVTLFIQRQAS